MELKTDVNGQRAVSDNVRFIHVDDISAPKNTKLLLFTKGGVIVVGHSDDDILGWLPLPRKPIKGSK